MRTVSPTPEAYPEINEILRSTLVFFYARSESCTDRFRDQQERTSHVRISANTDQMSDHATGATQNSSKQTSNTDTEALPVGSRISTSLRETKTEERKETFGFRGWATAETCSRNRRPMSSLGLFLALLYLTQNTASGPASLCTHWRARDRSTSLTHPRINDRLAFQFAHGCPRPRDRARGTLK